MNKYTAGMTRGSMQFETLVKQQDRLELSASLHENAGVFEGHFPDFPLVPGVVQVDWAMNHQCWYPLKHFIRLDKLKFKQVILPGDTLMLVLQHEVKGKVGFSYHRGEELLSCGCLVFRD